MPLAAARRKVSDLPLEITLDDSMAMMPAMQISRFDKIKVGARVSLSGNPIKQPGDWTSAEVVVDFAHYQQGMLIELEISEQY